MNYHTINELYTEIQKAPNRLSLVIPQIYPIAIECKDYENYCLLSLWEKPFANTREGNSVLLGSIVDTLCRIGLTQEEALKIENKAYERYFHLRIVGENKVCPLSAREMENSIDTTKELLQVSDSTNMSIMVLYRRQDIEKQYAVLHSLVMAMLEKYQLIYRDEDMEMKKTEKKQKVFIVHGRDTDARNKVELFLRRINLQPVILDFEPNAGLTIIEKLEKYSDVNYAIILYTACDEGRLKGTEELRARARQNVLFEHGYFCATLGRENVVALHEPGVEIPNDLAGVLYISFEDDWEKRLRRELVSAEVDADWTKG